MDWQSDDSVTARGNCELKSGRPAEIIFMHEWMLKRWTEIHEGVWKDFSSKVEAGARVLIGQKPQNCRADWRNIGFGKLSRNDGWVFEHIFSCSHYLFSGLQPPVSHYSNCDDTLFVFDLHAQTNNYINLYKLTKWTVISNCSLVTDPETQIQLKFTVSWQPSDTYDCISTKIHFFQGKRWASQHIYGVQVFGQMFVPPLKRKTKHFYVAICNQSLQFIEFPSSLWRTAGVKS